MCCGLWCRGCGRGRAASGPAASSSPSMATAWRSPGRVRPRRNGPLTCGSPAMPARAEQGRRLALVVASSDYRDPALRQLRAPGHDAADLAAVLGDPAIGTFEVRALINAPSEQLLRGIARFCQQAGPGDLVLVYLSCHGVLDSRGRLYYATIDTERALLSATAVAAQWLNDQLDDCRARRQILLLDCCHSGAFAKGGKGDDGLARLRWPPMPGSRPPPPPCHPRPPWWPLPPVAPVPLPLHRAHPSGQLFP